MDKTMENKLAVKLLGPAKVNGKREPVGKVVHVSPLVASQLAEVGAIPPMTDLDKVVASINAENSDFETAVADKAHEIAESTVAAAVYEAVSEATAELVAERDQALRSMEAAETRITFLERLITETKTNTQQPSEGDQAATDDGSAPQAGATETPATKIPLPKSVTKKAAGKKAVPKKPTPKKNATGG